MQSTERLAAVAPHPRAAPRQRLVRAAGEIALLEADGCEHALGDGRVLRLAAVRRAREREFLGAPLQIVEPARREQRHHLERLGAGAPHGDEVRIARAGHELVPLDDGRVHAVPRLHGVAARDFDVEVQLAHPAI